MQFSRTQEKIDREVNGESYEREDPEESCITEFDFMPSTHHQWFKEDISVFLQFKVSENSEIWGEFTRFCR